MSGIFFDSTGGKLDEPCQTALAGNGNRYLVAAYLVARQEELERLAHQLGRVGIGLAEDFWILDVVEGIGRDRIVLFAGDAAQRLERALANIDPPHGVTLRHRAVPVPCWRRTCGWNACGLRRSARNPGPLNRLLRNEFLTGLSTPLL